MAPASDLPFFFCADFDCRMKTESTSTHREHNKASSITNECDISKSWSPLERIQNVLEAFGTLQKLSELWESFELVPTSAFCVRSGSFLERFPNARGTTRNTKRGGCTSYSPLSFFRDGVLNCGCIQDESSHRRFKKIQSQTYPQRQILVVSTASAAPIGRRRGFRHSTASTQRFENLRELVRHAESVFIVDRAESLLPKTNRVRCDRRPRVPESREDQRR